jgi:hypothetical protein
VEAGYSTLVTKLYPLAASDKNDVLVGLPPTAFGQRAMAFLRQVAERSLTRESEKEDPSSAAAAGVPSTTATGIHHGASAKFGKRFIPCESS